MCYRCATNPSIHHHHRHIVAMSSPLSHHGVAFTSVTVSLLPLQCCLRCRIIVVLLLPLCCCSAFAVALLRLRHPRCSVAFVVTLSPFHRHIVAVLLSPSWCRLRVCHGFVIAIAVSPSRWSLFHHCHHGVAFVVASLRCHYRSCVVV